MNVSPLAGKPATPAMRVDVPGLVTACYTDAPDSSLHGQRVAFATSGHRGCAFKKTFNEAQSKCWRPTGVEVMPAEHDEYLNKRP